MNVGVPSNSQDQYGGNENPLGPPENNCFVPRNLRDVIAKQEFFRGLSPAHIELLANSAMEIEFEAGQYLLTQGDPANRFFVILEGRVAIETDVPEHSRIPVGVLGPGDEVGWSWLFPPHLLQLSARAIEPTKALFFYAVRIHQNCEQDNQFGYEIMKRSGTGLFNCLVSIQDELVRSLQLSLNRA